MRASVSLRFIRLMMRNFTPMELVDTMRRASDGQPLDLMAYLPEIGLEDTALWNKSQENGS